MSRAERHLLTLGLSLLALTLGALALRTPAAGEAGSPARTAAVAGLLALAGLVEFAAIARVLRGVPRRAIWLVVAIGLALRLGPLLLSPGAWNGRAQAAAMIGFEILAMASAAAVLRRCGRPTALVVVWAWNPLAVWAFAGNGQIDAAAAGLLGLALWATGAGRRAGAGLAFAATGLTGVLPLAAAPALWPRAGWRGALAAVAGLAALYALHAGAGNGLAGVLPSWQGLADASGVWLLAGLGKLVVLPRWAGVAYAVFCALVLAVPAFWCGLFRPAATPLAIWRWSGRLLALALFALSPQSPWPFALLALPAMVAPSRGLIWLATAPLLLWLTPGGDRFLWPCLIWLPALALALADLRRPLGVPLDIAKTSNAGRG